MIDLGGIESARWLEALSLAWVVTHTAPERPTMLSNSSKSEATMRLSVKVDEWWVALLPMAKRCHSAELRIVATSLPQRASQTMTMPALTSRRRCWCPVRVGTSGQIAVQLAFDDDGGVDVDGDGIVQGTRRQRSRPPSRPPPPRIFPASNRTPAEQMFTGPQYNTWIEMPYPPTQQRVLDYVRRMLDAGFPPGL